jgi:hypothetical protein
VDSSQIYADYYFMEALLRYQADRYKGAGKK